VQPPQNHPLCKWRRRDAGSMPGHMHDLSCSYSSVPCFSVQARAADAAAVVSLVASPGEDTLLVTLASARLLSLDIGRLDALQVWRLPRSALVLSARHDKEAIMIGWMLAAWTLCSTCDLDLKRLTQAFADDWVWRGNVSLVLYCVCGNHSHGVCRGTLALCPLWEDGAPAD